MQTAIYRLEIFQGASDIPVRHGLTRQFQAKLGHAGLLAVVWDTCKAFIKHDICYSRRRCRAVRQQRRRRLRLYDRPVTVLTAFRTDQLLLHITDTFHFCRGYAQLCADFLTPERHHFRIAVRTAAVFVRDRYNDITDRDVCIAFIPCCFFLFCPCVLLLLFLRLDLLFPLQHRPGRFLFFRFLFRTAGA